MKIKEELRLGIETLFDGLLEKLPLSKLKEIRKLESSLSFSVITYFFDEIYELTSVTGLSEVTIDLYLKEGVSVESILEMEFRREFPKAFIRIETSHYPFMDGEERFRVLVVQVDISMESVTCNSKNWGRD